MKGGNENQMVLDRWKQLRSLTLARIGLPQTGVSIGLKETLAFKLAHAHARDAVHTPLDITKVSENLQELHHPIISLHSMAADRMSYLMQPDLGRRLNATSIQTIKDELATNTYDICIVIADGLSATAIHHHIQGFLIALMDALKKTNYTCSPFFIVAQGRVAISDEIGALSRSKLAIICIGERPGLSSPDSLGIYLTYGPKIGNSDAMRNCISNIHQEGLSYDVAAKKLLFLLSQAMQLQQSGVLLKESSDNPSNFINNKTT